MHAPYKNSDLEVAIKLFAKAFSDSEGEEEGALIGQLVSELATTTDSQDIYGFTTSRNNQIVGCIFFTRLTFETSVSAFLLSPVAIDTEHQGQGIGQSLIRFGINQLQKDGVQLLFTYGDPEFYSKVGFKHIGEHVANAPVKMSQPEGWLCQPLQGDEIVPISGKSYCVAALNKPEYW